ncbi:hypothetical protein Dimus_020886, partial [Dionaea muscipula]
MPFKVFYKSVFWDPSIDGSVQKLFEDSVKKTLKDNLFYFVNLQEDKLKRKMEDKLKRNVGASEVFLATHKKNDKFSSKKAENIY